MLCSRRCSEICSCVQLGTDQRLFTIQTVFISIFLPETSLLDCVTVQAERHAEAAGWTAWHLLCRRPARTRHFGEHLGLVELLPPDQPEPWQRRRWNAASLGGFRRPFCLRQPKRRLQHWVSWIQPPMLGEVGAFLTALGHGLWIIAGDFNMSA